MTAVLLTTLIPTEQYLTSVKFSAYGCYPVAHRQKQTYFKWTCIMKQNGIKPFTKFMYIHELHIWIIAFFIYLFFVSRYYILQAQLEHHSLIPNPHILTNNTSYELDPIMLHNELTDCLS